MSSLDISEALESLADDLERTADWRRRKADEYPDDRRNIEAAEEMERIAKELRSGLASEHAVAYAARFICAFRPGAPDRTGLLDGYTMVQETSEYMGRIGFGHAPSNADELLRDLIRLFDRHGPVALMQEPPTISRH